MESSWREHRRSLQHHLFPHIQWEWLKNIYTFDLPIHLKAGQVYMNRLAPMSCIFLPSILLLWPIAGSWRYPELRAHSYRVSCRDTWATNGKPLLHPDLNSFILYFQQLNKSTWFALPNFSLNIIWNRKKKFLLPSEVTSCNTLPPPSANILTVCMPAPET